MSGAEDSEVMTGADGHWWITQGPDGPRILGPFATKGLAMDVRWYVEQAKKPRTFWVEQRP